MELTQPEKIKLCSLLTSSIYELRVRINESDKRINMDAEKETIFIYNSIIDKLRLVG